MSKLSENRWPKGVKRCQPSQWVAALLVILSLLLSPALSVSAESAYYNYLPLSTQQVHNFFVSPQGNDSNPGTYQLPWKTLGKAAGMLEPGTTLYVREGFYNEYVSFRASGTRSMPIKIMAYPGEHPIIDGMYGDPGAFAALLVIRGDNVQVSGFEVRQSKLMGIYVYGDYDVVSHMYVHHNRENGILVIHGSHSTVENNLVARNVLSNEYGQGDNWSTGLSAARDGVSYATIRHNIVWENWGEGISTFEADHTIIEDNVTHDNFVNNIYISDSTNILCQRNLVYTDPNNTYTHGYGEHEGIALGDELYTPPSANIVVINNISFGNQGNLWWWQGPQGGGMNNVLIANNTFVNGIGETDHYRANVMIAAGNHQNVRFENNIIQQEDDLPVIDTVSQAGVTYSHNLWSSTPEAAATGPGDIIADPLFSHLGDPFSPEWYKLSELSPAVNSAVTLAEVTVDYYGFNRLPQPDMGAHEFFPAP